ncbi:MAG: hemerythrin domain-containing protein [Niastella sp.]|nr:hemerythrin domain-containing protein [Niastella sp.]
METKRYNIFNLIHKALRSMMFEAATAIQQTDFTNREEAIVTIHKLEKVLDAFDDHADHEDKYIMPAVERYAKQLVDELESQHVVDHELTHSLRDAISRWKATEEETLMVEMGLKILYDFNEFIAFNLSHMNKEEVELNAVLWQYYSDPEIMHISHTLVSSIEPAILFETSRWMMASINSQEAIAWLTGIRHNAPQEVYSLYMKLAQEELSESRWQIVKTALAKGVMQVA